jgi:hypothetical protein
MQVINEGNLYDKEERERDIKERDSLVEEVIDSLLNYTY